MNVFILNTGRCGSTTFIKACAHITNYSSGHETRCHLIGKDHMAYPKDHIEADNRLTWFLGRLDEAFGKEAHYVHLRRDDHTTAESFVKRYDRGIMKAYHGAMLMSYAGQNSQIEVAMDYCETVNSNIRQFLKDKPHRMDFALETAQEDFKKFWVWIGAEGDLDAALAEWTITHNATKERAPEPPPPPPPPPPTLAQRIKRRFSLL
ncbi:MAG: hypothetical protein R2815_00395 [Flavobacteriales bacterium]